MVELELVPLPLPDGCNVLLGQAHFIKTASDLFETLAEAGGQLKFGVAFCEASGKRLVRSDGNDAALVKQAEEAVLKVGAGHSFAIYLQSGFPVSVLNRVKAVSEVCSVFAATGNLLKVVVAVDGDGRGILGVIDGQVPLGVETLGDKEERAGLLRNLGYKR